MDLEALVDAFEAGEISDAEFPHERHVRVAWALARRYEPEHAFERLKRGIQVIAARAGRPERYHETITRAWFRIVSLVDDLDAHPHVFDKRLLGRHWSPERLEAGRREWTEPDLLPLP